MVKSALRVLVVVLTLLSSTLPTFVRSVPAQAATAAGYPTGTVDFMASTRTEPYLTAYGQDTYWGFALRNPGSTANDQTVAVGCWWDGDWATGNYSSNRWFDVYVYESYDGYDVPRWLFVHSSYVTNQPRVPECQSSPTGIWLPKPAIQSGDNAGNLTVHLSSFPVGPATYFCHSNGSYPTGGQITRSGHITISAYDESWSSGLCSGSGQTWIGISAADGHDYYGNEVNLNPPAPPPPPPSPPVLIPGYLGGAGGGMVASPNFIVRADLSVDLFAENYGQTNVFTRQFDMSVIDPNGARREVLCHDPLTGQALTDVTLAPGDDVNCHVSVRTSIAGGWTFGLDYLDAGGTWRYDYLFGPWVQNIVDDRPANDDFADAEPIQGGTFAGSTQAATAQPPELPRAVRHYPFLGSSVWYSFVAPTTGYAFIDEHGDNGKMVGTVSAFTGNFIGHLAHKGATFGRTTVLKVTAGTKYSFSVDTGTSSSQDLKIPPPFAGTVRFAAARRPANDTFAEATALPTKGIRHLDLTASTTQPGEPNIYYAPDGSVWYHVKPAHRRVLTIRIAQRDFDAAKDVQVGVYQGTALRRLVPLKVRHLVAAGERSARGTLRITLLPGRSYRIQIAKGGNRPDYPYAVPAYLDVELAFRLTAA